MKVIIDGDACPVIKEVEYISKKYGVDCFIVKNHAHNIHSKYSKVITVDTRSEQADFEIVNMTEKDDIIVTQDYGLCGMVIAKDAVGINQYGKEVNSINVDILLMKRDINRQIREKHNKYTKFKKRTKKDNKRFQEQFEKLIKKQMK